MANTVSKKLRENPDNYIESGKFTNISKRHYRIYHCMIQKKEKRYDNDYIEHYDMSDDEDCAGDFETGVNQKRWNAHDRGGFDEYKEGN